MNKESFLKELEYLLSPLEEEEREEALQYYRDYFEEAGPEDEQEILDRLGSPEKVAMEIRYAQDFPEHSANPDREEDSGPGEDCAGAFTERGYRDARFEESYRVPDQYTQVVPGKGRSQGASGQEDFRGRGGGFDKSAQKGAYRTAREAAPDRYQSDRRRNIFLLVLLFVFFGLPLAGTLLSAGFSVLGAVLGLLLGVFGGMIGLIAGGIGTVIGLLAGGIGMIVVGAVNLAAPALGTMVIAFGFFLLALAALAAIAVLWGCCVALPGVFRFSIGLVRKCIRAAAGLCRRLFGKRGESR